MAISHPYPGGCCAEGCPLNDEHCAAVNVPWCIRHAPELAEPGEHGDVWVITHDGEDVMDLYGGGMARAVVADLNRQETNVMGNGRPKWQPHIDKVGDKRVTRGFHLSPASGGYVVTRVTTEVVAIVATEGDALDVEV